jgi:hypothetical protein
MHLDLSDDQTAALLGELDRIIDEIGTRSRRGSARSKRSEH